jgi:hypothetical protein
MDKGSNKEKKTWARELSLILIIGLGVLAYEDKVEFAEIFVWPVTIITVGAFLPNKLQQLDTLGLLRKGR